MNNKKSNSMNIKNVKVAFLGNMNDVLYMLMKFFNQHGLSSDLFVFNFDTFDPKANNDYDTYKEHVRYLSWGQGKDLFMTSKKQIKKDIGNYDFYITTSFGGAFLNKIGIRKKNIHILHGSDIDILDLPYYIFRGSNIKHKLRKILLSPKLYIQSRLQRKAMKNSLGVCFKPRLHYLKILKKVKLQKKRVPLGLYFVEKNKDPSTKLKPQDENKLRQIRKEFNLVLFSPVRQSWKNALEISSGNDVLIKGVKLFKKNNPTSKIAVIQLEYGFPQDSKDLIKKMGMEEFFFWLPRQQRSQVQSIYKYCDLVVDQFVIGSYGLVLVEGALENKPTMLHIKDKLVTDKPPYFEAKNPSEVARQIEVLYNNPKKLKEAGQETKKFIFDNHGEKVGLKYLNIVKNHIQKRNN